MGLFEMSCPIWVALLFGGICGAICIAVGRNVGYHQGFEKAIRNSLERKQSMEAIYGQLAGSESADSKPLG